jgi:hypothetical protein
MVFCLSSEFWITTSIAGAACLVSIAAVITSIASYRHQVKTFELQIKHDALSVRPVLNVSTRTEANRMRVSVDNNGLGPAIITKLNVTEITTNTTKRNIIDLMPEQSSWYWTDFVREIGFKPTLLPGSSMILIELADSPENHVPDAEWDAIAECLSNLMVAVHYTDFYDTALEPIGGLLDFKSVYREKTD